MEDKQNTGQISLLEAQKKGLSYYSFVTLQIDSEKSYQGVQVILGEQIIYNRKDNKAKTEQLKVAVTKALQLKDQWLILQYLPALVYELASSNSHEALAQVLHQGPQLLNQEPKLKLLLNCRFAECLLKLGVSKKSLMLLEATGAKQTSLEGGMLSVRAALALGGCAIDKGIDAGRLLVQNLHLKSYSSTATSATSIASPLSSPHTPQAPPTTLGPPPIRYPTLADCTSHLVAILLQKAQQQDCVVKVQQQLLFEAQLALDKALSQEPGHSICLYLQALVHSIKLDYKQAIKSAERCMQACDGAIGQCALLLGVLINARGNRGRAQAMLECAIQQDAGMNSIAYLLLGSFGDLSTGAVQVVRNYTQALVQVRNQRKQYVGVQDSTIARDMDSTEIEVWYGLGLTFLRCCQQQDVLDCINNMCDVIKKHKQINGRHAPHNITKHYLLQALYYKYKKKRNQCIQQLDRVQCKQPYNVPATILLSQIYKEMNQHDVARALLENISNYSNSSAVNYSLGKLYRDTQQIKLADTYFNIALQGNHQYEEQLSIIPNVFFGM